MAEADAATAKAEAASAKALVSHSEALIARLKLEIEKVRRELYGSRSERKARLLEQMELQLEELEADAGEDELAADIASKASTVRAFERKRPSRKPFPEHLPRERVVIPAPSSCPCCGLARLSKLGEDITETLEVIPRQWKVIQTVREKLSCRECEKIMPPHKKGSIIHPKIEITIPVGPKTFKNRPVARSSTRRMETLWPK